MREIRYKEAEYKQNAIGGILIFLLVGGICLIIGSKLHFILQLFIGGGFLYFSYVFGKKYLQFVKEGKNQLLCRISEKGIETFKTIGEQNQFSIEWKSIERVILRNDYLMKETRILELEIRPNENCPKKPAVFYWSDTMDIEINELVSWLDHFGVNMDNIIRQNFQKKGLKKANMPFSITEALFGETNIPIYKKTTTEKISAIHVDFYYESEAIFSDGSRKSKAEQEEIDFLNSPALIGEIIDSDADFKEKSRKRYAEATEEAKRIVYTLEDLVETSQLPSPKRNL